MWAFCLFILIPVVPTLVPGYEILLPTDRTCMPLTSKDRCYGIVVVSACLNSGFLCSVNSCRGRWCAVHFRTEQRVKQVMVIDRRAVEQAGVLKLLMLKLLKCLMTVGAVVKVSVLFPQVVYSTTASVPKVETVKPANNKDDDIDIDAI